MPVSRYLIGNIPWYSVLIVLGMAAAIGIASMLEKRKGFPKDTIVDLCLWLIPLGILGARLYYVIFSWDTYRDNPISILYIWKGGLAIYGGIIAGFLTIVFFSKRKNLPLLRLLDVVVPGVILAQAIGRWGNFFNMEAYGLEIKNPAFQFFPIAVQIPENGTIVWHMATFFYESSWNLISFAILMLLSRKKRCDGCIFLWYLVLYGAGRMLVEGLRTDSLMSFTGGIRVSQLLSVVLCIGAALGLWILTHPWQRIKKKKTGIAIMCLLAAAAILVFPIWPDSYPGNHMAFAAAAAIAILIAVTASARARIPAYLSLLIAGFLMLAQATIQDISALDAYLITSSAMALIVIFAALSCTKQLTEGEEPCQSVR